MIWRLRKVHRRRDHAFYIGIYTIDPFAPRIVGVVRVEQYGFNLINNIAQ